jgi:hypothetical protein
LQKNLYLEDFGVFGEKSKPGANFEKNVENERFGNVCRAIA